VNSFSVTVALFLVRLCKALTGVSDACFGVAQMGQIHSFEDVEKRILLEFLAVYADHASVTEY
jgi:hypothetical protein